MWIDGFLWKKQRTRGPWSCWRFIGWIGKLRTTNSKKINKSCKNIIVFKNNEKNINVILHKVTTWARVAILKILSSRYFTNSRYIICNNKVLDAMMSTVHNKIIWDKMILANICMSTVLWLHFNGHDLAKCFILLKTFYTWVLISLCHQYDNSMIQIKVLK